MGLLALLVAGFVQNIGMISMTASLLSDAGERFRSCGSGSWGGQRHRVGGHEGGGWCWGLRSLQGRYPNLGGARGRPIA